MLAALGRPRFGDFGGRLVHGLRTRAEVPPYLNPRLPVDTRVRDLLSRMTLGEKVGQMAQADLLAVWNPADVEPGKLPREWPRNGQQSAANGLTGPPLFPYGYGLSY